ncbi:hypothetical protein MAPG_01195 [Magnaporthiopsis poae ATCC 64411]|uniref:C2H2-type domain-containing protein n=1 Tax=Magnaporthiopsis poae (strain ATCC 64411 / 73-15) TaxID=644358 RepID=A0A0C4DN22_MAGP6|nr:hypothetical protein MAPG_01195 [Magnaporthiopsis poae ATCC 64411]
MTGWKRPSPSNGAQFASKKRAKGAVKPRPAETPMLITAQDIRDFGESAPPADDIPDELPDAVDPENPQDYLSNPCKCKHRDNCACDCKHATKCKETPYHRCEFCQAAFHSLIRLVNHYKDHIKSLRDLAADTRTRARQERGIDDTDEIESIAAMQVDLQRKKNGQFEASRLATIERTQVIRTKKKTPTPSKLGEMHKMATRRRGTSIKSAVVSRAMLVSLTTWIKRCG